MVQDDAKGVFLLNSHDHSVLSSADRRWSFFSEMTALNMYFMKNLDSPHENDLRSSYFICNRRQIWLTAKRESSLQTL